MKRIFVTMIRDLLNLCIYAGVLITIVISIYKISADLEQLKNVLFPMNVAILICIFASIVFVFINRVTTLLAMKLMER